MVEKSKVYILNTNNMEKYLKHIIWRSYQLINYFNIKNVIQDTN